MEEYAAHGLRLSELHCQSRPLHLEFRKTGVNCKTRWFSPGLHHDHRQRGEAKIPSQLARWSVIMQVWPVVSFVTVVQFSQCDSRSSPFAFRSLSSREAQCG